MTFQQVRQYIKGLLSGSFANKSVLDKLGERNGELTYDGEEVAHTLTQSEWNEIFSSSGNSELGGYSTSERSAGKWVNGDDLYIRSYSVTLPSEQQEDAVILTLTSGYTIRHIDGFTESGVPVNYFDGTSWYIGTKFTNNTVICNTRGYNGQTAVITVKYTKPVQQES